VQTPEIIFDWNPKPAVQSRTSCAEKSGQRTRMRMPGDLTRNALSISLEPKKREPTTNPIRCAPDGPPIGDLLLGAVPIPIDLHRDVPYPCSAAYRYPSDRAADSRLNGGDRSQQAAAAGTWRRCHQSIHHRFTKKHQTEAMLVSVDGARYRRLPLVKSRHQ